MIKINNWLKLNIFSRIKRRTFNNIKVWLFLLSLAAIFFIGASAFNNLTQEKGFVKWSSPDETANYHFAKLFGQEEKLSIFEKNNLAVNDIIHPRSFRSDFGEMKPVSFPGILLIYGQIVSWTGYEFLPFITPLFAAVGLIFYFLLIERIFGRRNAILSTLILSVFPVYVYFSAHSMFHNILFIVLLIIGMYYAVLSGQKVARKKNNFLNLDWRRLDWKKFVYPSLAGLFFGLAIITRTSELIWLGPTFLAMWLINIKNLGFTKLVLIIAFICTGMLPAFYWNQILYGSPINTGYPEMNQSLANIASASSGLVKSVISPELGYLQSLIQKLKDNIFHFGFHPRESLRTFVNYFVLMFPWIFWPASMGLILLLQKWRGWAAKHYAYFISFIIFSTILVLYYGSWDFHDNPNPNSFTIGNSYTRYWLPIYLAAIPLASLFVMRFSRAIYPYGKAINDLNKIKQDNWRGKLIYHGYFRKNLFSLIVRIIFVFFVILFSFQYVLFQPEEGLVYQVYNQKSAKTDFDRVLALTENNSTIITRYHDKLFFPERKVIIGLFDDQLMIKQYAKLQEKLPLYYYNFTLSPKDIDYLNKGKLLKEGIQIEKIAKINLDFSLYKIVKYIPPPPPIYASTTPIIVN